VLATVAVGAREVGSLCISRADGCDAQVLCKIHSTHRKGNADGNGFTKFMFHEEVL
jgi:hypothetical protein